MPTEATIFDACITHIRSHQVRIVWVRVTKVRAARVNAMQDRVAQVRNAQEDGRDFAQREARFNTLVVDYLRMAISLIEGRPVRSAEILEMLVRVIRQHRLVRRDRVDYVLQHLNEHAP